ncbi:MAG: zinc ribbon domain-containing protein [Bacteriovorax sp.]|nr:zinc ribbon domain-containing protein [Bacteriovorax sp.]
MVFCRACGKEIDETAIHCSHCGTSQSGEITEPIKKSQSEFIGAASLVLGVCSILAFAGKSTFIGGTSKSAVYGGIVTILLGSSQFKKKSKFGKFNSIVGISFGLLAILAVVGKMKGN